MPNQLTSNAEALRLFFNDDIYLVKDATVDNSQVLAADLPSEASVRSAETPLNTTSESATIVEEPLVPEIKQPALTFDFKFVGGNQKQILILVNDANNEVSTAEGRELLRKLVKAIGLTGNDFALVNYTAYQEANYKHLQAYFSCKLLLAFGVSARQLGLGDFPLHQLVAHENVKMVFTANLHALNSDQQSKKILWASLQQISNG